MAVAAPPQAGAEPEIPSYRLPLFLFGVGLGGFVDGIALHQILQWHHMLSDTRDGSMETVAGLERNTVADGLFHAVAFAVVVVALYLTMRTRRRDPSGNVVEGLVNHHLLAIHHVRDDVADHLAWDLSFLAVSVVLLGVGIFLTLLPNADPIDLSA
jgi:uncharacterized membrane protein